MSSRKRSHKTERLARIYDDEILPVWAQPFGRMLLRDLELAPASQILDVACGTGYVTVELLRRMAEGSRIIAIDGSSALLDVARRKVERIGAKGVFFRTESAEPRLSFADDVYDLVVCNLGLAEMPDLRRAIADFARVTRPGGAIRCTIPLAGTFEEFYDIYREVLIKHDKREARERLDRHLARYPSAEDCEAWMQRAGLEPARVELDEFSMLFKSSREFFFAPLIDHGPLATWKAIAGEGQEMQDVFWHIKAAIDAYFGGRAFEITVKAGCLIGVKRGSGSAVEDEDVAPLPAQGPDPVSSTTLIVEEALIESELFLDAEADAEAAAPAPDGTAELDIAELVEILPGDDVNPALDDMDILQKDVGLDAFIEGRERPAQLDDD